MEKEKDSHVESDKLKDKEKNDSADPQPLDGDSPPPATEPGEPIGPGK